MNSFPPDVQVQNSPVRMLPYSLVPGMLTSSRPYFKAITVISKQRQTPDKLPIVSNSPAASSSKGKKGTQGTFLIFSFIMT